MTHHDSDVVVVGAGIVGAFAALRLAQRNRSVILFLSFAVLPALRLGRRTAFPSSTKHRGSRVSLWPPAFAAMDSALGRWSESFWRNGYATVQLALI